MTEGGPARECKRKVTSSCSTGGHVFLLNKKKCLLVQEVDRSSCRTRRHFVLFNKKARLLVQQEDVSEDMSSC